MPKAKDTARNTTKTSKPAAAQSRQVAKNVSPRSAPATQPARDETRGNGAARLSPEDVYRLIQESAYFRAKARGFAPGHEVQDWIEAEAEVRMRLEDRT
jgi:hypothetical protein